MEIGKRIRSARLEAGLSQTQLCGDQITRNMLSQIENGSANPSLATLSYFSRRLQKPVGYFFGEEDPAGRRPVDDAWNAYRQGKLRDAADLLNLVKEPDRFRDASLLRCLILLQLAESALRDGREPYARELLRWAEQEESLPEIHRSLLLLRGKLEHQPEKVVKDLPSLDEELRLRAAAALEQGDSGRAERLLEAAENQEDPDWAMLRGKVYLQQKNFRSAADCFHLAEKKFPEEAIPFLELCYRELEDFKRAYFYACRRK